MQHWIWVLIPLAAIFAGVMKRWIDLKQAQLDRLGRDVVDEADSRARQVARLEERVRVLERIVTDKGLYLAEEVDGLRDERIMRVPHGQGDQHS
jgi:hypothetical protein